MEEGRRDIGPRERREKRRKCARGGPGGMEEAEAAWKSEPVPREPRTWRTGFSNRSSIRKLGAEEAGPENQAGDSPE